MGGVRAVPPHPLWGVQPFRHHLTGSQTSVFLEPSRVPEFQIRKLSVKHPIQPAPPTSTFATTLQVGEVGPQRGLVQPLTKLHFRFRSGTGTFHANPECSLGQESGQAGAGGRPLGAGLDGSSRAPAPGGGLLVRPPSRPSSHLRTRPRLSILQTQKQSLRGLETPAGAGLRTPSPCRSCLSAPPALSPVPRPRPPKYETNLQTSVRCHWQEAQASGPLVRSKAQLGCTKRRPVGVGSSPPPPISRARLKPHVWRPHAAPWKDVPYKQHEAEPVTWPYLWSPNQVPAPRAGCCRPLLSPDTGCRRLRLAEAQLTAKGLSGRQQVQGGRKGRLWGLPRGASRWVDGRRGGPTVRRQAVPPWAWASTPPAHCPGSPGSCPHVALISGTP